MLCRPLLFASLCACALPAQQPQLQLWPHAFTQQPGFSFLQWTLSGRGNDLFVLLADFGPGPSLLLGTSFDLDLSPATVPLSVGQLGASGFHNGTLAFLSSMLPAGTVVFAQYGAWSPGLGLASLQASNGDSTIVHGGLGAVVFDFTTPAADVAGVFDRTVLFRLQALPPSRRTVRPLPPSALPFLIQSHLQCLHPSGSRFQFAFRAQDLGSLGVPELLTAIRWRPLFASVVLETLPQFEWRAAHSDVVPDYTIDPWSQLPAHPGSGLSTVFAQNPQPGSEVVCFNGSYTVRPQDLQPSGYLPFPAPQLAFVHDGASTLLIETRCWPAPGGGPPQNQQLLHTVVQTSPQPHAGVYAVAGHNGQPQLLVPTAPTTGRGDPVLPDWELELLRTASVAVTPWAFGGSDFLAPHVGASTPPGTSLSIEFRGAQDLAGTGATAWSSTQDVADGRPAIQVRVSMQADLATGAVPWIDTLVVPFR
jgi:hypothetical protein